MCILRLVNKRCASKKKKESADGFDVATGVNHCVRFTLHDLKSWHYENQRRLPPQPAKMETKDQTLPPYSGHPSIQW